MNRSFDVLCHITNTREQNDSTCSEKVNGLTTVKCFSITVYQKHRSSGVDLLPKSIAIEPPTKNSIYTFAIHYVINIHKIIDACALDVRKQ